MSALRLAGPAGTGGVSTLGVAECALVSPLPYGRRTRSR
jgi:hypothetical protein